MLLPAVILTNISAVDELQLKAQSALLKTSEGRLGTHTERAMAGDAAGAVRWGAVSEVACASVRSRIHSYKLN